MSISRTGPGPSPGEVFLGPGDVLEITGPLSGQLLIHARGTAASPAVVRPAHRRATLQADGNVVVLVDPRHVEVRDLDVVGTTGGDGVLVWVTAPESVPTEVDDSVPPLIEPTPALSSPHAEPRSIAARRTAGTRRSYEFARGFKAGPPFRRTEFFMRIEGRRASTKSGARYRAWVHASSMWSSSAPSWRKNPSSVEITASASSRFLPCSSTIRSSTVSFAISR